MSVELWACEAYGQMGIEFGALCFFTLPHQRQCQTSEICKLKLEGERIRLWDRMHELARLGDDIAIELLRDITGPECLLGGPGADPDDDGR